VSSFLRWAFDALSRRSLFSVLEGFFYVMVDIPPSSNRPPERSLYLVGVEVLTLSGTTRLAFSFVACAASWLPQVAGFFFSCKASA